MDFFPTMLELAGLPLAPQLHAGGAARLTLDLTGVKIDGRSVQLG